MRTERLQEGSGSLFLCLMPNGDCWGISLLGADQRRPDRHHWLSTFFVSKLATRACHPVLSVQCEPLSTEQSPPWQKRPQPANDRHSTSARPGVEHRQRHRGRSRRHRDGLACGGWRAGRVPNAAEGLTRAKDKMGLPISLRRWQPLPYMRHALLSAISPLILGVVDEIAGG
jgi:hypothetical protein